MGKSFLGGAVAEEAPNLLSTYKAPAGLTGRLGPLEGWCLAEPAPCRAGWLLRPLYSSGHNVLVDYTPLERTARYKGRRGRARGHGRAITNASAGGGSRTGGTAARPGQR